MTQRYDQVTTDAGRAAVYSSVARMLHWLTAAAVFVMVPVGL